MCLDSYPSGPFVQTVTNDSHAGVLFNLVLPETPPWCNKLPFHDQKMVPECIAGLADYKKKWDVDGYPSQHRHLIGTGQARHIKKTRR